VLVRTPGGKANQHHAMRIALVTYAIQVGGVETVIRWLGAFFRDQGHTVDVMETESQGRWSALFERQGISVRRLLPKPTESRLRHARRLAGALSHYDVLVLNNAAAAQAALGLLPTDAVVLPVLHSGLTSFYKNATGNAENWDAVVAVSPALQRNLIDYWGIPCERARYICNGIPVADAWPKRHETWGENRPLKLVYVGAVESVQKGVLRIPDILRKIARGGGEVSIDVVGGGPDLDALRWQCAALPSTIQSTFHGSLANAEAMRILAQADGLLMPSNFEGMPIVLLESMAAGVVPVVSRLEGCTDVVVEHGLNGCLAEIGRADQFAEAILSLAKDRSRLASMSEACWRRAHDRLDYRIMGSAYLDLALELLEYRKRKNALRSGILDRSLLGDLPWLPRCMVRPVRKALRVVGRFPPSQHEPLLFRPTKGSTT